jgi:hypothetical protein
MVLKYKMILAVLIIESLMSYCTNSSSKSFKPSKGESTTRAKPDIRKKPASGFKDSLYIARPSAVFFQPDSTQMEKIKAVNETMIYESLTHDCYYQMQNARLVIERNWPSIQVIVDSNSRWLVFKKLNANTIIDLDKINNICGIYLFDGAKEPVRIDMTNIDSELGFYFKRN